MILPLLAAAGLAWAAAEPPSSSAAPAAAVPGYELVYSYPEETSLSEPDLRRASEVWPEMFDAAKASIDLEHFYATPAAGEPLDPALEALARAARRGVRVRVLLEKKFEKHSAEGIARLRAVPGLELRILDWSGLEGDGIVHAKYFVVDATAAYVGSQNFDWRALKHIHELGLRVTDSAVVPRLAAVFEKDWSAAAGAAAAALPAPPAAEASRRAYLVASPWRRNPPEVGDSQAELVRLIAAARERLQIQLLDYAPLTRDKPPRFYPPIDNALRDAAARGVRVELLVSHWNLEGPALRHLQSLSLLPGISIRYAEIPPHSAGPVPFARVIHSKYMVVDGRILWLGTSNWSGGYLDRSRNVEVVVADERLAGRAARIHEHLWSSPYARALEPLRDYHLPRR